MPGAPAPAPASVQRIVSIVEGLWGRSIVYDESDLDTREPDPEYVPPPAERSGASLREHLSGPTVERAPPPLSDTDDGHGCADDEFRLGRFEAALLATVLEDAVSQLNILDACNTELRTRRTLFELDELLAVKFGVLAARDDDNDGDVDPSRLHCDHYKLRKLDRDRAYFRGLVALTYRELALRESFARARSRLRELAAAGDEYEARVADERRDRQRRRELARLLRQQRNRFKSVAYETAGATEALRTRVEDAALNGAVRARYVRRWQAARGAQHALRLERAEAAPTDAAEACKLDADAEQRVHVEVELLVAAEIDGTLKLIEEWMDKYEADTERIDLRTQIVKNDYQNALEERLSLEETLGQHAREMAAWRRFKEERERERRYREGMRRAAVSVQAWWRGLLVRRELGPYRPPKKGKAKSKK